MAAITMSKIKISAKNNHPIYTKLDKLMSFLKAEDIELSFYKDRIFIQHTTTGDGDWEIIDHNNIFINELPCTKFKLSRDAESNKQVNIVRVVPSKKRVSLPIVSTIDHLDAIDIPQHPTIKA